jgi:hypothetical protein
MLSCDRCYTRIYTYLSRLTSACIFVDASGYREESGTEFLPVKFKGLVFGACITHASVPADIIPTAALN